MLFACAFLDQLVAGEACKLGYQIRVPLPYHREVYREELQAKEDFDALIEAADQTGSVLELDAIPRSEEGYERVGRTMFRHSDILVAIWDPQAPEKHGGGTNI